MKEVDMVDYLHVSWKNVLKHAARPSFKSFRQNSVICVSTRSDCYIPSSFPRQSFYIDQNPHQLWDGEGGMGVVQLDGNFIWER